MLQVLTVGQTSVPFVHRTSVVSVLAPMETMLYLLHRHCSLPPKETGCTLPLEETCCSLTSCSLPSEETGCSLPPEEIGCSLPNKEIGCFLPLEETLLLISCGGFNPKGFSLAEGFIRRRSSRVARRSGFDQRLCFIRDSLDQKWLRSEVSRSEVSRSEFALSKLLDTPKHRDWFSFAKCGDPAHVCMEGVKSRLKLWKEKYFMIDRTTIPRASLEEISITRPDCKVVPKFDNTAKRKASTGPEISTNATKKTISNQRDCLEFATEDIESLNDVSQCENINIIPLQTFDLSIGLDVIYPLILLLDKDVETHGELFKGTLDADVDVDEISSHGNVDPYYKARVGNTVGDVVERDLLLLITGPYYIPYPYGESSRNESPTYTKDDWEEINGVNPSLQKKELYKDPKKGKLSSWDNKHRKYMSERDALAIETAKIKEELFNRAFAGVLNTAISVGGKRGLHMDHTDEDFRELSQRVNGFIPDAKEKFDIVVDAFPATTFPFLDKVSQNSQSSLQDIARLEPDRIMPSHQTSSATTSLRANTHV
ncbi:hypothetical protein Tco_0607129 [Tanacetum coccineum]